MELKGEEGLAHRYACMHPFPERGGTLRPRTGSGSSMMRMNVRILACIACALIHAALAWPWQGTKRGRPRTNDAIALQIGWQQRP